MRVYLAGAGAQFLLVLSVSTLGLFASLDAGAFPITVAGHGVATHTSEDLGVPNPFTSDDTIDFTFSYESEATDLAAGAAAGRYQIANLHGAVNIDGSLKSFRPSGGSVIDIQVFPGFVEYEWYLRGSIVFADGALGEADLGVSLRGPEGNLAATYGDDLIAPPRELLPADQWFVVLKTIGSPSVTGLGTMDLRVIPEPGTLALLALGLAGIGWSRRKQ